MSNNGKQKLKVRYKFTLDYTSMNINIKALDSFTNIGPIPRGGGSNDSKFEDDERIREIPSPGPSTTTITTTKTTGHDSMAQQYLASGTGWLSFNPSTPRLYVAAESDEFDDATLKAWTDEGFQVQYVSMEAGAKEFRGLLHKMGDGLSIEDRYAIVAFGDAAAICLEEHQTPRPWNSKCCAIVAYYPTSIPSPDTRYSSNLRVLVHLAGGTVDMIKNTELLGIRGKRRTITKRITPGTGVGGLQTKFGYRCYSYTDVDVGFAERDLDEYDGVAEGVAWSRSLKTVRDAFNANVDLETSMEAGVEAKYHGGGSGDLDGEADRIVDTFGDSREPYVVNGPTLTGAIGKRDLNKFYGDVFLPASAEEKEKIGLRMKLVSRTVGVDRIVDEVLFRFTHAAEMEWILPGIPPTDKKVEIMVVCIVAMRGAKIWCEHTYWDQASVLLQVGLLDPKLVSEEGKSKNVKQLPVLGKRAARGIVEMVQRADGDDGVEELNKLMGGL